MALAPPQEVAGIPRSLVTNFHHKSDFHRSQPQLLAVGPDESKAAIFSLDFQTRKPSYLVNLVALLVCFRKIREIDLQPCELGEK